MLMGERQNAAGVRNALEFGQGCGSVLQLEVGRSIWARFAAITINSGR
jgi:hypothetical protein